MRVWAFFRNHRHTGPRSRALAAAVLPVAFAAGCSGGTTPAASESPSPSTPDSAIDPVEAEAVIDTYRAWRDLENEVVTGQQNIEDVQGELDTLVTEQFADDLQESMEFYEQHGVIVQGESKIDPDVTAMDLDSDPPRAVLVDCLDTSDSDIVDLETGESRKAPPEAQSERVVVTARSEKTPDGRWVISELSTDFDRSC